MVSPFYPSPTSTLSPWGLPPPLLLAPATPGHLRRPLRSPVVLLTPAPLLPRSAIPPQRCVSREMEQKKLRTNWKLDGVDKTFLESCIHEVALHGSTSTGVGSWGPSSTLPRRAVEVFDENDFEDIDATEMQLVVSQKSKRTQPTQGASEEFSDHSKNKRKPSGQGVSEESLTGPKKGKAKETFRSKVLEVGENISRVPKTLLEKHNDMKSCMTKLKSLGWGQSDARYKTTLLLFGESYDVRKVFLELEPESCGQWVEIAGAKSITYQEKMVMFFIVIGHNERLRMVKRRFQHSTETIHRCFHEVLNGMMNFARELIVPTSSNPISDASDRHRRLKQIFPGAIGALDGTLVHAIVPTDQQTRYRGRGKDKYYLCGAAYTNTRGFMAPYRNTRYWLADFRRQRAMTKEEKFNHAHAQLRNVIERAYGVLKARFPILKQMAPFPFPIQRDIVIAYFAIHNFIRKWNIHDQLFMEYDEGTLFGNSQDEESHSQSAHDMEWGSQSIEDMAILRDEIATQLMSNN
ncbi:hypothetical protein SSX86_030349 [Deinandra increscens subsp. villosa]|uniref:DDE Tnp4 domain-containing protein n=1 Tax=Deinandra increscens subsp. villosa TaxID=3103831 RepID=A0AAP0C5X3_9ASTR